MHEFYLLDMDYIVENEKPVLRLFGRIGKKSAVVLYRGFQPYLYVLADSLERAKKKIESEPMKEEGREVLPLAVEIVDKKLFNKPAKALKVILNNPRDVPAYREFIKNLDGVDDIREYDIPFVRRFLIDSGITPFRKIVVHGREAASGLAVDIAIEAEKLEQEKEEIGIEGLNALSFDIEVYNPEGAPRVEIDPVIMASFADLTGWAKVISTKECNRDFVETVKDERELLQKIVQIIKEKDADILVTYNGDAFDFDYLKRRAEINRVKLDLGRDGNQLQFLRRGRAICARMKGRVHVDLYHLVFNIIRRTVSLPTYTLSALGARFLGIKDWDVDGEIWKMWDSDKERQLLADYSRMDAIATIGLAREFIPLQVEFSKLIRESLFDITRMTSGQLVEWLLMNKAYERNEIAPNRPKFDEKSERYEMGAYKGAYVREPLKGLQENLAVFDFRSLYPSIIVTFNVDPSMLDVKCEKKYMSPTGHWFCAEGSGFIPEILKELIERRAEIKKRLKALTKGDVDYISLDAQQYALKLLSNSFYGFYGYSGARWYSRECAESITAWGRQYIQETFDKAEKAGFTVVYGDTDSLFVKGEGVKERAPVFLKELNESLPGIMSLDLDGFYVRGVFVTKKRYALIDDSGKITTKGLEVVRRDWAKVAKDTQQKVIRTVLEGHPEKATDIVKKVVLGLKSGQTPLEDLVVYTQLTKGLEEYKQEGPHVAAARRAIADGRKVEKGSIIAFIVCKGHGTISDRSKPVNLVKPGEYDSKYYVENQVLPPVLRIFEALGYGESDLIGGQRKLFDF